MSFAENSLKSQANIISWSVNKFLKEFTIKNGGQEYERKSISCN